MASALTIAANTAGALPAQVRRQCTAVVARRAPEVAWDASGYPALECPNHSRGRSDLDVYPDLDAFPAARFKPSSRRIEDAMERTPDGRYIVVGGKRWRTADPRLADETRAALLSALGRARAAVRNSRGHDRERARERVQMAKEGLGERGAPWWELTVLERERRARSHLNALSAAEERDSGLSDIGKNE